jgi:hypothetical protein
MENIKTLSKPNVQSFGDFEKSCKKEVKGGDVMYVIGDKHKSLTLSDLFEYWYSINYIK